MLVLLNERLATVEGTEDSICGIVILMIDVDCA
jgi:hypothetical protein